MSAHDQVANKEYPLLSVADDGDELMGEQALRIVYIKKKSDPLVGTSFQFAPFRFKFSLIFKVHQYNTVYSNFLLGSYSEGGRWEYSGLPCIVWWSG